MRIAVVTSHPIQYQVPLWRRLAALPETELLVIFGSDVGIRPYRDRGFGVAVRWDVPLTEGYEYQVLSRDESVQQFSFTVPSGRGVEEALKRFQPEAVLITSYHGLLPLRSVAVCRRRGIGLVLRHEASDAAAARSRVKSSVRDLFLQYLYSQIDQFAVIGAEARRHLSRLGVPAARMSWSPYCVDSGLIEEQVLKWAPARTHLRAEQGLHPEDRVLLFSGKLIEKKQPLLLLRAIEALPDELRRRIQLVIMGDGEQRNEVELQGRSLLGDRLHMVGFVNQSELGRWYALADWLVLPSRKGAGETWGLVVNEALQFGLPVVVSDGVGCRDDLVNEDTGYVFDAASATDLTNVLRTITSELPERRAVRSAACRRKAEAYSVNVAAAGLTTALSAAAAKRHRKV